MRFGLELPNVGDCGNARVPAKLARLAEEHGWDGVFIEDYITDWTGELTCDPWVALAAIAMATTRIRIGTEGTPVARRRPWKLARETVTLDHLSGGRLTLGVEIGDPNDPSLVSTAR